MRGFPAFVFLFATAGLLAGQDGEAVMPDAMKQIGPANGVLGKKITAKDASAAEDAKKLQSLFASTRGFWKARKANDVVRFATDASGASLLLLAALPLVAGVPPKKSSPSTFNDLAQTTPAGREAENQYRLGLKYAEGKGALRDYAKAADCYLRAAERGHIAAQYNLGFLYENGLGVKTNLAMAMLWYRKAAEQGDAQAQTNLGVLYATAKGSERSYVEAAKWYMKAAGQDDLEGMTNLGSLYLEGRGVKKDYSEALAFYKRAANRGYPVAQNNLALMYANGQGVPKDYVHAYAWLDLAGLRIPASAALRDRIAKEMTAAQIAAARNLVSTLKQKLAQAR
ncbi:tetratricopeptide repeat protein [Bryobacter aggregatus]|uniref:tetratricopeptide repeat protein n=1 Tax=Bryobacter aggregatus TaxID=360054 RepID=UPI00068AB29B|nr:tetratricopeptide repeat protein [Bryobacter aggregatus]